MPLSTIFTSINIERNLHLDKLKFEKLKDILAGMGDVLVAYSGGTDSTLVLKVAYDLLGPKAAALTAVSPSMPASEQAQAVEIARSIGALHFIVQSDEFSDPEYIANTPNRCFFCKKETFGLMAAYAREHGFHYIADGTNVDDTGDFRPGRQAAKEYAIRSPLLEAGFTKAEIRQLSKDLGLPNWDKPAMACLSSRIPYGMPITMQALSQVERAEEMLHQLGLRQLRVRHHGNLARIEADPKDHQLILENCHRIVDSFKAIGYLYITLDLAGFRSGSMNEAIQDLRKDAVI